MFSNVFPYKIKFVRLVIITKFYIYYFFLVAMSNLNFINSLSFTSLQQPWLLKLSNLLIKTYQQIKTKPN